MSALLLPFAVVVTFSLTAGAPDTRPTKAAPEKAPGKADDDDKNADVLDMDVGGKAAAATATAPPKAPQAPVEHRDIFLDVRRADGGGACSAEIATEGDDLPDAIRALNDDREAVVRVKDTATTPLHLPRGSYDVAVVCPLADGAGRLAQVVHIEVPGKATRIRVDVAAPAFLKSAATSAHHLYAFDAAGHLIARAENSDDWIAVPAGNVRVSLLQVNRHIAEAQAGFLMPQSSTLILLAPKERREIAIPGATGVIRVKPPKGKPKRGEEMPSFSVLTVQGPRPDFGAHPTGVVAYVPFDTDFRVPIGPYLLDGKPIVVNEGKTTAAVAAMMQLPVPAPSR